jgi:NAD(P)-dependent dehydrogenase (short-subunit alcohol dehydrogenase family)
VLRFNTEIFVQRHTSARPGTLYFTLSRFIPLLSDGASVIMLSSTSTTISPQTASMYAASKAAINAVVKIAALELTSSKIRVNAVSPRADRHRDY